MSAPSMLRDAVLSDDAVYRYQLFRGWRVGAGAPRNDTWIMLNPSTADARADDPTIRRCMGFSAGWGATGLRVVNLFALRATDPADLLIHPDPIGPDADQWIAHAVSLARIQEARVVVAWGAHPMAIERARHVRNLVGGPLFCLGRTRAGQPRHPLYIRSDTPLTVWGTP